MEDEPIKAFYALHDWIQKYSSIWEKVGTVLMGNRIFDKKHVIISRIHEENLNSFLLDLDIGEDGRPYYPLYQ